MVALEITEMILLPIFWPNSLLFFCVFFEGANGLMGGLVGVW